MGKKKPKHIEFKTKIDGKKIAMQINDEEIENLEKLKKVDDLLGEFKQITDRINTKIDKWNTQK
jgi:flavoprotein